MTIYYRPITFDCIGYNKYCKTGNFHLHALFTQLITRKPKLCEKSPINSNARSSQEVILEWTDSAPNKGITIVNGAIWGLWSLLFAITIFIISRKFNLLQTASLAWFFGFVLMWIVLGNMGVFPFKILYYAFPLSILEAFLAAFIIVRLSKIIK